MKHTKIQRSSRFSRAWGAWEDVAFNVLVALAIPLLTYILATTVRDVNQVRSETVELNQRIEAQQTENARLRDELAQQIEAALSELAEPSAPEIEPQVFTPLDVPLPEDMQHLVWELSQEYNVPFEIVMAIMWAESRHRLDHPDNHNTNGSIDRGVMQINDVHWQRFWDEYELDVNCTYDNIMIGIMIISDLWQRHPPEMAVAAYQSGEWGMLQGGGRGYAARVLEQAKIYGWTECEDEEVGSH